MCSTPRFLTRRSACQVTSSIERFHWLSMFSSRRLHQTSTLQQAASKTSLRVVVTVSSADVHRAYSALVSIKWRYKRRAMLFLTRSLDDGRLSFVVWVRNRREVRRSFIHAVFVWERLGGRRGNNSFRRKMHESSRLAIPDGDDDSIHISSHEVANHSFVSFTDLS